MNMPRKPLCSPLKRPNILVCWECGRRLQGVHHRLVYCQDDPLCEGHPAHKVCHNTEERASYDCGDGDLPMPQGEDG